MSQADSTTSSIAPAPLRSLEEGPQLIERDFDVAADLVDELLSTKSPWGIAMREWCFRGQDDADYGLTAALWRPNAKAKFCRLLSEAAINIPVANPFKNLPDLSANGRMVMSLLLSERLSVQHFFAEADRLGLQVNLSSSELDVIRRDKETGSFLKSPWSAVENSLPDNRVEAYALAQHHGIPTQLLDFTSDPLVAAYFAVAKPCSLQPDPLDSKKRIAIWALHRKSIEGPVSYLKFVDTPRGSNHFLRTQRGTFILDTQAAKNIAGGEATGTPCITRHLGKRIWIGGQKFVTIPPASCYKYTLPLRQAESLADILQDRGICQSSLMPTFDNVAKDVLGGVLIRSVGAIG